MGTNTHSYVEESFGGNNLVCTYTTWHDLYMWEIHFYSPQRDKYYCTTNDNGVIYTGEEPY